MLQQAEGGEQRPRGATLALSVGDNLQVGQPLPPFLADNCCSLPRFCCLVTSHKAKGGQREAAKAQERERERARERKQASTIAKSCCAIWGVCASAEIRALRGDELFGDASIDSHERPLHVLALRRPRAVENGSEQARATDSDPVATPETYTTTAEQYCFTQHRPSSSPFLCLFLRMTRRGWVKRGKRSVAEIPRLGIRTKATRFLLVIGAWLHFRGRHLRCCDTRKLAPPARGCRRPTTRHGSGIPRYLRFCFFPAGCGNVGLQLSAPIPVCLSSSR